MANDMKRKADRRDSDGARKKKVTTIPLVQVYKYFQKATE